MICIWICSLDDLITSISFYKVAPDFFDLNATINALVFLYSEVNLFFLCRGRTFIMLVFWRAIWDSRKLHDFLTYSDALLILCPKCTEVIALFVVHSRMISPAETSCNMRFTVISSSVSISDELQLFNLSEPISVAPHSLITLIYSSESLRSGLTERDNHCALNARFPLHKHMVDRTRSGLDWSVVT